MNATFDYDSVRRVVIVTVTGELTDDDLLAGYDRLVKDPRFDPQYNQLVDLRGANGRLISDRGVRALVGLAPEFDPSSRRAIVVASDLGFGMARMFALLRSGEAGEVQVFRDLAAAKSWLGI